MPSPVVAASPASVPSSAAEVRSDSPCARYSTTAMISVDALSATTTGFSPRTRAGSTYTPISANAMSSPISARSPRPRATRMIASANTSAIDTSGSVRS